MNWCLWSLCVAIDLFWIGDSLNEFVQDIPYRYWFTSLNGSTIPPLPTEWPILPLTSLNQIVSTNPSDINAALWFLDGYSNKIYSSKNATSWNESLTPITIIDSQNQNKIINTLSHIVLFPVCTDLNNSFYGILSSNNLLQFLFCNNSIYCINLMQFDVSWTSISSSVHINDNNAYLGTNDGLLNVSIYNIDRENPKNAKISFEFVFDDILEDNSILALSYNENLNVLAIGQRECVFRVNLSALAPIDDYNNYNLSYMAWTFTFGLIDSYPTDMEYFYDDLYVVNNASINVLRYMNYRQIENMPLWIRIGRHQQLPFNQILFVEKGWDNSLWFGHSNGAISRFTPNTINHNQNNSNPDIEGKWRYYQGNRYLVGDDINNINDIYIVTMYGIPELNMLFIATTKGLTLMFGNKTDLETKTNVFEEIIYPRHDRYGQVASCQLSLYGNISSWRPIQDDNNGLYTSMYLTGLTFKYAITGDNITLNRCLHHMNALSMLHNVTGIKGLVARSFSPISDGYLGPTWINSTAMNGWQWKSDTSSDEICGHIYIYILLYDLVAQNIEQKTFILNMMVDIIDYIIDNDYKYIDYNGQQTSDGFWSPEQLNFDASNSHDRGLNSLEIESWIFACFYYTNYHITMYPQYKNDYDPDKYLKSWLYLGNDNGYFINILNEKMTIPNDINHPDDTLAALSFMTFFWTQYQYNNNHDIFPDNIQIAFNEYFKPYYPYFLMSWQRQYKYLSGPYFSWYTAIEMVYNININKNESFEQYKHFIIEDLERWPMEWIHWETINSDRIDLIPDFTMGRDCGDMNDELCSRNVIPHDQNNCQNDWNDDPYKMDSGNGYLEFDTGSFTMTYWFAKYFTFI